MSKVKSDEEKGILKLGESVREHPKGIIFSVPIFLLGFIYYSLTGDRKGVAGALGHCGIAFKNYYRHH